MRDVIRKVIESEEQAKRLVQAATAEAEGILSGARKESQKLLSRALQEARTEAEAMLAAATQQAEQEKQKRLALAETEIKNQLRLDETTRQRAVEAVIRCVCGFG